MFSDFLSKTEGLGMESTGVPVVWHHGSAVYGIGRRLYFSVPFVLIPYARRCRTIPCRLATDSIQPYGLIPCRAMRGFNTGEIGMRKNLLLEYGEQLAVAVVTLCKTHKIDPNTAFQIKKSSSSVFANITEAQYPQSLADMHSKFEIARKECAETESWLKLIFASDAIDESTFKSLRNLCGRIKRMLTASCITIENKLKQG